MDGERVRLAQAYYFIRQQVPDRYIFEVRTDSILFDPPKKKQDALLNKLRSLEHASGAAVFRVYKTDSDRLQQQDFKIPSVAAEPPSCARTWTRHSKPEALVAEGKSFMLTGGPGTGKSFTLRKLYDLLIAKGVPVVCTAKTNVAVSLLPEGSLTLNRLSHQAPPKSGSWVIIDEISLIDTCMWAAIARLAFVEGLMFILCETSTRGSLLTISGLVAASLLKQNIRS